MESQVLFTHVPNNRNDQTVVVYNNGEYVTTVKRQLFRLMGHGDKAFVRHHNRWMPVFRDVDGDLYIAVR